MRIGGKQTQKFRGQRSTSKGGDISHIIGWGNFNHVGADDIDAFKATHDRSIALPLQLVEFFDINGGAVAE